MPDSDLEHQTQHLLAQLETMENTEAETDVMGANEDGRELNHTEQNHLSLDLGQEQWGSSDHYCSGLQPGKTFWGWNL